MDVFINGTLIDSVQIDSGLSDDLMNVDTMEELGLETMTTTPIIDSKRRVVYWTLHFCIRSRIYLY